MEEYSIEYSPHEQQLTDEVIYGIFQKLLHKSAVNYSWKISWNMLFVMFLFHFFMEYSRNILHVRPHPKGRSNVPDIVGKFQEYSKNYFINKLLLMGRIFNGIFLCMQLFVMFLFHF